MKLAVSELMKKHEPLLLKRETSTRGNRSIEISRTFHPDERALTIFAFEALSAGFSRALAEHANSGKPNGTAVLDMAKVQRIVNNASDLKGWKDAYEKPELHPTHRKLIEAIGCASYIIGRNALNGKRD